MDIDKKLANLAVAEYIISIIHKHKFGFFGYSVSYDNEYINVVGSLSRCADQRNESFDLCWYHYATDAWYANTHFKPEEDGVVYTGNLANPFAVSSPLPLNSEEELVGCLEEIITETFNFNDMLNDMN